MPDGGEFQEQQMMEDRRNRTGIFAPQDTQTTQDTTDTPTYVSIEDLEKSLAAYTDPTTNKVLPSLAGGDIGEDYDVASILNSARTATSVEDPSYKALQALNDNLEKRTSTRDAGFLGTFDDPRDADNFLSAKGSTASYVDAYGQTTPTGVQADLAVNPTLPEGTELKLKRLQAQPGEFMDSSAYQTDPRSMQITAAQAKAPDVVGMPTKTASASYDASTVSDKLQEGQVAKEATVAGQLEGLMKQFEGGEIPAFASGAMRSAQQMLASRGLGASSMAGEAIVQAAMESSIPIAAADAATYASMGELNFRTQAQALFNDQAAQNASKQFNAQSKQQNDQFFSELFNSTARFNAAQKTAVDQFNAGQTNVTNQFNSELASQREQFNMKNRLIVDQANVEYRRHINTANTALANAEAEYNSRNLFNISQTAMANTLQQHRDDLNYARVNSLNDQQYKYNLSLASYAFDKNLDLSQDIAIGGVLGKVGGAFVEAIWKDTTKKPNQRTN